ncbi:hypothetical protein [Streptomyces sp. NPDC002324]
MSSPMQEPVSRGIRPAAGDTASPESMAQPLVDNDLRVGGSDIR